ncbi:hypothetical protein [Amycolatopsis sp. NPDC051903]|uniref:hypothetical protein n=1 Tax=Amycolatopsis sp. NPDC051903 TaxID=3363936 RepID=UPI0037874D53
MTYLDLVSSPLSGQGVSVVMGGVTVAMPRPHLPIGGGLGMAPALEPTANGVLVGIGTCVLPERGRALPLPIRRRDQAVQAAPAFDRDLGVAATSPAAEAGPWRVRWGEQQRTGGRT